MLNNQEIKIPALLKDLGMIFPTSKSKKQVYLGLFKTPIEAALAYDNYVLRHNLEHTINGVL
jgi:hypothetical protein